MFQLSTQRSSFSSQLSLPLVLKNLSPAACSYANDVAFRKREKSKVSSFAKVLGYLGPDLQKLCCQYVLHNFKGSEMRYLSPRCFKPLSYVSSSSFFENKNGFPESHLLSRGFSSSSLRCSTPEFQSFRGFKARSSKKITGLKSTVEGSRSTTPNLRERLLMQLGWKKDETKLQQERERSNKIKTLKILLADETLTPGEQIISITFPAGYRVADTKEESAQVCGTEDSKEESSLKFDISAMFRDLLLIILIICVVWSMISSFLELFRVFSKELRPNEVSPDEVCPNEVCLKDISVTFEDVKGVDESKQELQEIVEFLRNPAKFSALGGKLPKGVLLVGPPGSGKTLLAKAVAGEANVPFFHASGSEFDEVYVGKGARRVRDLFSNAKKKAPCIIFIDEIDSVGAKRNDPSQHYRQINATINQLLSEMDGFHRNNGIIVLGATNRRDDLDEALLRPGRFDMVVAVPVPDLKGRKDILKLYLGKVKLGPDVDVDVLARGTTGFSGAELENLVNQAAIRAAINGSDSVMMSDLENSWDKVVMGLEYKSRIPDKETNIITAYHEGGHALVSHYTKDSQPLHKVTIISRGSSLGHTAHIPAKELYLATKSEMLAKMDMLMGGRAAEELIFGPEKVTSGAASDLKKATAIAHLMVKEYGMSEEVGVMTFEEHHTSEVINAEVKRLLFESYERAKNILKIHSKELKAIADALLEYETLDAEDVKSLITGDGSKRIERQVKDVVSKV